ncbi:putative redox protein [Daejeonella rubra]|uniref:Putative redox protein n=1 Tax=Daejeonella rubra TaxID=990371 RepID=A0A1G9R5D2_9SPHI|nr:OsmC family protein [Daejeonella rubra]SDM18516.1 putative redox protein [Daejeonella rubra]
MASVRSHIGKELYKVKIWSPGGNIIIADEPVSSGGQNAGFSPLELIGAALAACTSATLRMYADRKAWELQEVNLEIEVKQSEARSQTDISRKIELIGNLSEEQRARLIAIANACPVHKLLSNPIEILTQEVNNKV